MKLNQAINIHNELWTKFKKAEAFLEKYPNYSKTNLKEFLIIERKIINILNQIDELSWLFDENLQTNSDGMIIVNQQVKLF